MTSAAHAATTPHASPVWWDYIPMAAPLLGLLFAAALVTFQFPSVTYALAQSVGGGNMMFIVCILSLVLPGATLMFVIILHHGTGSDMDEIFIVSAFASAITFGLVLLIGFFLQRSSLDHIGMYNWWRLSDAESILEKAKEESKLAATHRDNQVFVLTIEDPSPQNIRQSYAYVQKALVESEYRDAMAAAAIIGLDDTQGYQSALARGWLWQSEKEAWGVYLRKHPPGMDKAPETRLAAYLTLTNSKVKKE
jgi:hypothetical protein